MATAHLAVRSRALYSHSFSVLRNPDHAAYFIALWASGVVTYVNHLLLLPSLLLSMYIFLPAFLRCVQCTRVDDLHFLQLVTIPALRLHKSFHLYEYA